MKVQLSSDLTVTAIGPAKGRLDELRAWWIRELRRLGFVKSSDSGTEFDDAFEFLAARAGARVVAGSKTISYALPGAKSLAEIHLPDDSIINGSSIVLVIEHLASRILLLGDAWAEDTVNALSATYSNGQPLLFDAIKVAHHGSMRNTSPALLNLVDSPNFIISTNGDHHGHPAIEVLKAIVDRPAPFRRTLHFNYRTPASQFLKSYSSASSSSFIVVEGSVDWIRLGQPLLP